MTGPSILMLFQHSCSEIKPVYPLPNLGILLSDTELCAIAIEPNAQFSYRAIAELWALQYDQKKAKRRNFYNQALS